MRPEELGAAVDPGSESFQAAVVDESHHLATDLAYLRVLSASRIPYVGLLGPPTRRDKLLTRLGQEARALRERLHAPIGLPLGGRTPEAVALTIVAEVQAQLPAGAASRAGARRSRARCCAPRVPTRPP